MNVDSNTVDTCNVSVLQHPEWDPWTPTKFADQETRLAEQAERNYARFVDCWKTRPLKVEVRERLNSARIDRTPGGCGRRAALRHEVARAHRG